MPATTPLFQIPYPLGTEAPNGPAQMQALGSRVETVLSDHATARTTLGTLQHVAGSTATLNGSWDALPETPVTNPFPVTARLQVVTNVRLSMGGGSAGLYAPVEVLLIVNDTASAVQVRFPVWTNLRTQEEVAAVGAVSLDVPAGATRRVLVTCVKRNNVTGTAASSAYSSFSGRPGQNWTQVSWT